MTLIRYLRYKPWKGILIWALFIVADIHFSIITKTVPHAAGGALAFAGFLIAWGWAISRIGEEPANS